MTLDDLIERAATSGLQPGQLEEVAATLGASVEDAYDRFARQVAERYCRGEYSWELADHAINGLYGYAYIGSGAGLPRTARLIFEAFDAGEFSRPGLMGEPLTRRLLADVIGSCGT